LSRRSETALSLAFCSQKNYFYARNMGEQTPKLTHIKATKEKNVPDG
jgi:hypothetical protein